MLTSLVFHHDGPFDACNPHRNRKGLKAAPMQAFPKDSRNMALGGAGPNNSNIDLAQFHGRGEEGFNDYAASGKAPIVDSSKNADYTPLGGFNPTRQDPIHGDESMGLGTSTFLEGAPASKTAMQRRESETEATAFGPPSAGGGLSRKKSLAQKIRGISNNRTMQPGGRITSPDVYDRPTPQSGGGPGRSGQENPFFQDYDSAYEQKGTRIQQAEQNNGGVAGSPRRGNVGLERRVTADSIGGGEEAKISTSGGGSGGGGFLNRMKSLKGGPRRAKTVRQPSGSADV